MTDNTDLVLAVVDYDLCQTKKMGFLLADADSPRGANLKFLAGLSFSVQCPGSESGVSFSFSFFSPASILPLPESGGTFVAWLGQVKVRSLQWKV